MRVLGGIGGLLACGAAGVAVAASPKPAGAPLTPPVDPAAPVGAHATATPSSTGCAVANGTGMAATAPVDPAVTAALHDLRAATTRAERTAVLQRLTPDQRQQLAALQRNGNRAAATPAPATVSCPGPSQEPMIQPEVVGGLPTAPPLTNSYVS